MSDWPPQWSGKNTDPDRHTPLPLTGPALTAAELEARGWKVTQDTTHTGEDTQ